MQDNESEPESVRSKNKTVVAVASDSDPEIAIVSVKQAVAMDNTAWTGEASQGTRSEIQLELHSFGAP